MFVNTDFCLFAVLSSAVLSSAVLSSAVLSCAVLSSAVLSSAILSRLSSFSSIRSVLYHFFHVVSVSCLCWQRLPSHLSAFQSPFAPCWPRLVFITCTDANASRFSTGCGFTHVVVMSLSPMSCFLTGIISFRTLSLLPTFKCLCLTRFFFVDCIRHMTYNVT